jgi:uncharacterized membrane protein
MAASQPIEKSRSRSGRYFAVDALRGLIIIFMALDHANYFVAHKHSSGEYWGGAFPVYTDSLAFMTRFITHLSAPGFFFLMGVGMLLFAHARGVNGWGKAAIIRHFVLRGVVLIAIQLLVVNRIWPLAADSWPKIYIGVLIALGGTMIIGSFLLWIRPIYLLLLVAALFLGMEILIPSANQWGAIQFSNTIDYLNLVLIYPGGNMNVWSNYPILPWLELVLFGMLFGHWLLRDRLQAYRGALGIGLGFLLGFLVVRYLDGFGNILPRMGDTWIDFLNVVKYPPSMAFTLLTMGLNLLLLGLFARANEQLRSFFFPLTVFGQTPLFFYIVHLFLYAGLGLWLTPQGTSIARMYPFWLLGLLILLPVCWLYGKLKHRLPANLILRYL